MRNLPLHRREDGGRRSQYLFLVALLMGIVLLSQLTETANSSTPPSPPDSSSSSSSLPISTAVTTKTKKDNTGNWEFITYNRDINTYDPYVPSTPEIPQIPSDMCPQEIQDPSFETFQGTPFSPWMQTSLRFGLNLICSPGILGCPTLAAYDGNWFARFPENDISSIRQSIFLDNCEVVRLTFWLWIPFNACLRSTFLFQVRIDNQVLFMITTPTQAEQYQSGWKQVQLVVPRSFADGATHTLIFEANTLNLLDITILVDLVQFIFVDCPECTPEIPSIPEIPTVTIPQIPTPTIPFICIPGSQCVTIVISEVGRTTAIRVCFVGRVGRTWTYQVRELSGRGLQLINLGIGTCVTNVVSAFPSGAQIGVNSRFNFLGIQWNIDQSFTSGFFSFTLDVDAAETSIPVLAQAYTGFSNAPTAIVEGLFGPDCSGTCISVTGDGIGGIVGQETGGESLNGAATAFGTVSGITTAILLCLFAFLMFLH